jgi:hypothetical protein
MTGCGDSSPRIGQSNAEQTFTKARAGDCLNWPATSPDRVSIVDCGGDHRFEVAESVVLHNLSGGEYGPGAPPPGIGVRQASEQRCEQAVQSYLGARYDPSGRFTVGVLWAQAGQHRMLCGLQLPGARYQQLTFKGRVAEQDQSKVWPAGTCLGIESGTGQSTNIPVDCSAPHAMEVTGAVNLADKFSGPPPAEADQDGFIKDACGRTTETYLSPVAIKTTTLKVTYDTISPPSWTAGTRQVACSVAAALGNGGWATLVGSAKGPLVIDGKPVQTSTADEGRSTLSDAAAQAATPAPQRQLTTPITLPPTQHLTESPPPDADNPAGPLAGPPPGPGDQPPPARPPPPVQPPPAQSPPGQSPTPEPPAQPPPAAAPAAQSPPAQSPTPEPPAQPPPAGPPPPAQPPPAQSPTPEPPAQPPPAQSPTSEPPVQPAPSPQSPAGPAAGPGQPPSG